MKDCLLFDLDGTLLDSMPLWDDLEFKYLRKKGISPPDDLRERVKTMSVRQFAHYAKPVWNFSESPEQIAREIISMIEQKYFLHVPLKPGVRTFLDEAKKQGCRMGIVTASEREYTEAALKRLGVLDFFLFILTCSEFGKGKDSPEIYAEAAGRIGEKTSHTVVFEDSLMALQTAKKAGCFTVGVYDKSSDREWQTVKTEANIGIKSFEDFHLEQLKIRKKA